MPTLHVRLPGTKVFTCICTNLVPSMLLHKMSVLGVFPSVTTAEYPRRHSSPAIKNWLAFPRLLFSFPDMTISRTSSSLLLLLLHRLLVFRYQLRLRMRRHRSVMRKIDGVRSLTAGHRLQPRLVVGKFR